MAKFSRYRCSNPECRTTADSKYKVDGKPHIIAHPVRISIIQNDGSCKDEEFAAVAEECGGVWEAFGEAEHNVVE